MRSRSFEDVHLWRKAHDFVLAVYELTRCFHKHELFGLTAQLRRAAVSVPANFAEGFKKRTRAEKARLYNIAQGSIEECRYYLLLAQDLGYGSTEELRQSLEGISRMLERYLAAMLRRTATY